jgi:RRXRR protein
MSNFLFIGDKVIFGTQLAHSGQAIKASLESRRSLRRGRRNRHTRYRQASFLNCTGLKSWLAQGLQHQVETTMTWVNKLIQLAPINPNILLRMHQRFTQHDRSCSID